MVLAFSLYFLLRISNPYSSLTSVIYSLRLVEVSWLHYGLTHVYGVQFDYSWQRICSIETVVMALELVPASKRLLGSNTPQGNTKLPRTWVVPSKHIPEQVIIDRTWACLSCIQNEMELLWGLGNLAGARNSSGSSTVSY